jgi:hypothetical protein
MTASMPADIAAIYSACQALAADKWPYVYGGGHNPRFYASIGLTKGPAIGYDCSGILCCAIHEGAPVEMPEPLGTHELASWGLEGEGEWLTVRVVNGVVGGVFTEHCLLEWPQASPEHRFFMAHFTDGPPAGFVAEDAFGATPYAARRKLKG